MSDYESCPNGLTAGMLLGDPCRNCGHVAGIHTWLPAWPGSVCAACLGLQEIRDALKALADPESRAV